MKAQGKRLRRALFLVPYVTKFGDAGVPLAELAKQVDVSPDVLRKEIESLAGFEGVPDGNDSFNLYIEGAGDDARVSALPCRLLQRPPRLTPQEALALLIGAEAVKTTGVATFDDAIARATKKIRGSLGRSDDDSTVPIDPGRVIVLPTGCDSRANLKILDRACRTKTTVELDYASLASQRRKKIRVQPYGLLNHIGCWYLLGPSLTHAEGRIFVFKVERILGVMPLDERFEVPKDFDVHKYAGQSMFVTNWKPAPITLRLTSEAARRFPKAERDGGGYRLTLKEPITGWLAAWVLRQGPGVSVVGPTELKDWVARLARRVVEAHAGQ